jgi:predicted transcriptional regulator
MRKHTVAEVMTRDVVSVPASAGYKEIVEVLAKREVSAVPVVDTDGHVIGVVSEADLLYKAEYAGQTQPPARLWERKRVRTARTKAGADTAADLMTAPAIVIGPDDKVSTAAKLMDAESVKRLPVVDEHGDLVGVVSRGDVLRLFLRPDEDIRQEVRDEVLLKTLWIDPDGISVEVAQGVVTLGGTLDRRSAIALVVAIVQSVAGVVDVVSHLSYHYDDRVPKPDHQSISVVA